MTLILPLLAALIFSYEVQAADKQHNHLSNYAGEEARMIKSLSPDDIAELKRGGGWGLAKTAELNGVPGPAHLLEMKEQIALSEDQVFEITKLFNAMKTKAIKHGEKLIKLEKELEIHFRSGTITAPLLRSSLDAIAEVRKELRYVHLATHLETPAILSADQIENYNTLRGYFNSDLCARIPEGHNSEMWRKHNGCQ